MKKAVIIGLVVILAIGGAFLAGRSSVQREEPAPAETVEPSAEPDPAPSPEPSPETVPAPEPEPETTPAGAVANGVPAVYCTLSAGEKVEIVDVPDEYPEYYLVHYQEVYGLVRKDQLKLEGEPDFELYTGYSARGAELHSSYFLNDTEPLELSLNTELQVLAVFDYCCYVEAEGIKGFVNSADVSSTYIRSGGGGGNSGGNSSGGRDGGDISLAAYVAAQEGECRGTATIKTDNTELILALYYFGDEVPVLSVNGDEAEVLLFGLTAKVETRLLLTREENLPEPKTGYAADETGLYDNFRLYGEPAATVKRNTLLEVLVELEDSLVVRFEGTVYHMAPGGISDTEVKTGGSGGGGSSGGGGNEWTEPVL